MIDQQAERRRERLHSIIRHHFRDENDLVVGVIKDMTGQEVSVRSIQTWLIDPRRASHRKVPEWVLSCLEDYINRPEKQGVLQRISERAESKISVGRRPFEWADEVRRTKAVDFATHELEAEAKQKRYWCDLLGRSAGEAVAEVVLAQDKAIRSMSRSLATLTRALHSSESFEDFRALAKESMQEEDSVQHFIRETREALANQTGEFSNEEGLPADESPK